jgi:SAM-dependent methyltransferase
MKRENTNKIRFILEELVPPFLRDSFIFKFIIKIFYRKDKTHQKLKSNILRLSKREYLNYYKNMPEMHDCSDLSDICVNQIIKQIKEKNVLDVGCGNGFLLEKIRNYYKKVNLHGTEINLSSQLKKCSKKNDFKIYNLEVEKLNKLKKKFDTVICTHVLEHILDINEAYLNLKKICLKRLIIVVPKERPYKHTFNGHIHFFPYSWSFINTIRPNNKFIIKNLKRDFLYIEDLKN